MKRVLHTALLSIFLVGPAMAQGRGKPAGDHALEGALIGGIVGAVFLGMAVTDLCGDDGGTQDCALPVLGGGAVGFLLGGSLGALVGVFIPKHPEDSEEERPNPYR